MNDKIASYNLGRYESLKKFNQHHHFANYELDFDLENKGLLDITEFLRGRIDGLEEMFERFYQCHETLEDF